jgi:hypothetical protein
MTVRSKPADRRSFIGGSDAIPADNRISRNRAPRTGCGPQKTTLWRAGTSAASQHFPTESRAPNRT